MYRDSTAGRQAGAGAETLRLGSRRTSWSWEQRAVVRDREKLPEVMRLLWRHPGTGGTGEGWPVPGEVSQGGPEGLQGVLTKQRRVQVSKDKALRRWPVKGVPGREGS